MQPPGNDSGLGRKLGLGCLLFFFIASISLAAGIIFLFNQGNEFKVTTWSTPETKTRPPASKYSSTPVATIPPDVRPPEVSIAQQITATRKALAALKTNKGRIGIALDLVKGMGTGGARYKPGMPNTLSTKAPASVYMPPPGENIHYGQLSFQNQPVTLFAIEPQTEAGQSATLFVDRNRDGDFTNDSPTRYKGTGTSLSAGHLTIDLLDSHGKAVPYNIWLWTTFNSKRPAKKPSFNYYASSHRRGFLSPSSQPGTSQIPIMVFDWENNGSFKADRVLIDWNQNRKAEAIEWLKIGSTCKAGNYLVTLEKIHPMAERVTLRIEDAYDDKQFSEIHHALAFEPTKGNVPPPLSIKDMEGRLVRWESYRGKVVIVSFWATWCSPCLKDIPFYKEAYQRFAPQGFEIISVSLNKDPNKVKDFLKENGIFWRQICDTLGRESALAKRYRVSGIPATFLIGRNGRIKVTNTHKQNMIKHIAYELKQPVK